MTTNLDDRVRVLMTRLGDATPIAPEFEAITARPVAVVARPSARGRRWPAVAVAAAVLVIGVVVAVRVRDMDTASIRPITTKQVATDLPEGWRLVAALGPGTATYGAPPIVKLFATPASPLGPVVALTDPALPPQPAGEPVTVTLPDGRRATRGEDSTGVTVMSVEVSHGSWVGVRARGLDETSLIALAQRVTVGVDRYPALSAADAAVFGLTPAGEGGLVWAFTFGSSRSDAASMPRDLTVTRYDVPGTVTDASITIYRPTVYDRAAFGLFFRPDEQTGNRTGDGSVGPIDVWGSDQTVGVYVERDGLAIVATGPNDQRVAIHRLVDSLAPVSDADWDALVAHLAATTSSTIAPVETTAPPQPTVKAQLDLAVTVSPGAEADEYLVTLTAPDGTTVTATARFVGPQLTVTADGRPSTEVVFGSDSSAPMISGELSASTALYLVVVPSDSPAVRMSLITGGVRRFVDLVELDPAYPVRVGIIVAPANASDAAAGRDPVLLDANGKPTDGMVP